MAAGMDFSPPFAIIEGGYCKDNVSDMENENLDNVKQVTLGKPPRHLSVMRHCVSSARLITEANLELDVGIVVHKSSFNEKTEFLPMLRSGSCAEIGPKQYMEDEHICIDDLIGHLGANAKFLSPRAFYGVFDSHGGTDAAIFIKKNILKLIVEDSHFSICVEKAINSAFLKVDYAFADASSLDISSDTTALIALISKGYAGLLDLATSKTLTLLSLHSTLIIANATDCQAVLGRRVRAIEMSKDHKPNCTSERLRIEKLGGVIYDGYLNGQLSVARALGDWHMKVLKGSSVCCDYCKKELMLHNDPERCLRELVREAPKHNTCDNLTVIVVCFSVDPPPQIKIPQSRVRMSISTEGLNLLKGVLDCN
ncbi:hypothetical protein CRYUN_Cryun27aG0118500 [Craigia yunnanensis]